MRVYNNEEYKIMQYILGKSKDDNKYTEEEWNFVKDFDFNDEALPEIAKLAWKHRNSPKAIGIILKILKDNEIHEYKSIFDKVKKEGVTYVSNN